MWSSRTRPCTHFTLFRSRPGGPEREERTERRSLNLKKKGKKKRREVYSEDQTSGQKGAVMIVNVFDNKHRFFMASSIRAHPERRAETGGP